MIINNPSSRAWLYWISRMLLGIAFICAALLKMASPQDFADSIAAYRLLPSPAINIFALGLPLFELSCGLFVLSGFCFRIGVLGILGMLLVFMTALVLALLRGLDIDCACFGTHFWLGSSPWAALVRDAILLLCAAFVYQDHAHGAGRLEQMRGYLS